MSTKPDLSDKGLFGTALLPKRNLRRRYLAANVGRVAFIAIALVAGLILVTLMSRIVGESYAPENEVEVDGIRLPTKTVASTQFSWKVETWDPAWLETNDLRLSRENVTIEAHWVETQYEAVGPDGSWTADDGQQRWDLAEDLERALCSSDQAETTFKPKETFRLGNMFSEREYAAYVPGEENRMAVFLRDTAPTPGMGDYWVDTDGNASYVWHGLRWKEVVDDAYLDAVLSHYAEDTDAYKDGKVWLHYTAEPPLFRGDGDLWFNRSAIDANTFTDVTEVSAYNQTSGAWEPVQVATLPAALLDPIGNVEAFEPEFCTKSEAAVYILNSGLSGSYSISEVSHPDGYGIELVSSTAKHDVMTVALTPDGARSTFVDLQESGFTLDGQPLEHLELRASPTSSVNWLFLQHRFNWTVTFTQTEGPSSDARESSYMEIGDFALSSGGQLIRTRFSFTDVGQGDLDGDGAIDACDEDLDGDGDNNPVLGDPVRCPGVGLYASGDGSTPMEYDAWLALNDGNGDGVHDDVLDRDIDGDGIANLINQQGELTNAKALFNAADPNDEKIDALDEIPEFYALIAPLAESTCSERHKPNDPAYAALDCATATSLIDHENSTLYEDGGLDAEAFCSAVRMLDQPTWIKRCAAPDRLEGNTAEDFLDAYSEKAPVVPMLSLFALMCTLVVMRRPAWALLRLRQLFLAIGVEEPDRTSPSLWSWFSFTKESGVRFISLVFRLALLLLGVRIFLVTFTTDLVLVRPFSFVIGGAMVLLGCISVFTAAEALYKLRPDLKTPPSEGVADLVLFVLKVAVALVAFRWVLVNAWIVPAVALILVVSGLSRLVLGGLQLTRTTRIQEDRLSLVVQGRDGWILGTMVVIVVGLATVPIALNLPFVFSDFPSSEPYRAGLRAAFWGSVYVVGYTMLFAIPLSIGAAIWLEEYAPDNRGRRTIQALITNLAGVPAIVFGLFGLAMFLTSRGAGLGLGATVMTAGMTMATMAMPTIVISSQEALRAVPPSLRNAAFGLGCTKWQVTQDHVLPHALPGMMTGTILAMSRIMGEAAPLILVGAVASVFTEPDALFYVSYEVVPSVDAWFAWIPGVEAHVANMPLFADRGWLSADPSQFTGPDSNDRGRYTVLPVQVYVWTGLPQVGFQVVAAAASIVLLATLVIVNSTAILLRAHFRRYSKT